MQIVQFCTIVSAGPSPYFIIKALLFSSGTFFECWLALSLFLPMPAFNGAEAPSTASSPDFLTYQFGPSESLLFLTNNFYQLTAS